MRRITFAFASVILLASTLAAPAFAGSMQQEIISIARSDFGIRRGPARVEAGKPRAAHWKTTVYNWNNNTKKTMNGYVPPPAKH